MIGDIGFIKNQPQRRPVRSACGDVVCYIARQRGRTAITTPSGELVATIIRWKKDPSFLTSATGGTLMHYGW